MGHPDWPLGSKVAKKGQAQWVGIICGYYSTPITPLGVCVRSESPDTLHSVQIYSVTAVEKVI